ncbi:aminoglycoside phosphotransferase family protein [Jeotgalibacillus sp. ET6]|uniref:phosphotransferase family protein n=1 Tax=Jeotgalibacillus sp. ET6 TaxID=3037260 RepID=UPI0024182E4B|nr:aminoglycoside phosphotransferase family protein [Jeotgalibacillus sp. ET6]MDG5473186.1 aminoglycoside phosphotransferase family protein [Jeotgalibacillus sp. ET6]
MDLGQPIARGNTAEIYLSKNKIIKVFNDFLPDTESEKEATKQRYAFSCGLPVPEVLEVTTINGKQAIIMEYVEGVSLGEMFLQNREAIHDYLTISVDAQLKIHSVIPDKIETMFDKLQRQIESVQKLDQRIKEQLLKKLNSFSYESRLCHGDFHLFNLIQRDQKITVIDWVDSSSGDIRADVCRTYLLYMPFSTELAELYITIYCEKSGLLKSEIMQWAPIIAAARLAEHVSTEDSERLLKLIQNNS